MCRRYCYEPLWMIEGYEEAVKSPEKWDCHHRVETIMNCGRKELIAKGCYYHRPAHELIFLPHDEHVKLHNSGRHLSEKTKEKMREAKLGKRLSEETKEKIRQAGLREKNPVYGTKWWNDGEKCVRSRECPEEGWKRGRLRTGA